MADRNTSFYKSTQENDKTGSPSPERKAEDNVSFFERALNAEEEEFAYRSSSAKKEKKNGLSLDRVLLLITIGAFVVAGALFFADIMLVADYSRMPEDIRRSMFISVNTMVIVYLAIVAILITIAVFFNWQIRKPLNHMIDFMDSRLPIALTGASELRHIMKTYNLMLEDNKYTRERFGHAASHDPLTGLYNRGAYELILKSVDTDRMGLLLIDIDHFKEFNDNYGHDTGDLVLKRVADIIRYSFRSSDFVCRIGGDEFLVIMPQSDQSMKDFVYTRINSANNVLLNPSDGLPPVSLSVGAAFSDRQNPKGTIFQDADTALYKIKAAGRRGCLVYGCEGSPSTATPDSAPPSTPTS